MWSKYVKLKDIRDETEYGRCLLWSTYYPGIYLAGTEENQVEAWQDIRRLYRDSNRVPPGWKTEAMAQQPCCSVYTRATFGFENQKLVFCIQIHMHILFHIYCVYVCVAESAYGWDPSFKIQKPEQLTSWR